MMSCTGKWAVVDSEAENAHRFEPARPRVGIASLVQDLPERYRVPFTLRYMNGLQPEQVAAALGRSLETTRADLNRAVNALREALSASRRANAGFSSTRGRPRAIPPGSERTRRATGRRAS